MVLTPTDLERAKFPIVMTFGLGLVASSHVLRCDAKQAEERFARYDAFIDSIPHFRLGDYLPFSFVKGEQPKYIEELDVTGVPVVSTLAIQELAIREEFCRYITQEDYAALAPDRKPRKGDVLVTMDGGTSIGKPVLFQTDKEFAIDSHVAILRPSGIDPRLVVYLLASPLGQVQFQRAESGASGQTGVTEDDLRLFRFPLVAPADVGPIVAALDAKRDEVASMVSELRATEAAAWDSFNESVLGTIAD